MTIIDHINNIMTVMTYVFTYFQYSVSHSEFRISCHHLSTCFLHVGWQDMSKPNGILSPSNHPPVTFSMHPRTSRHKHRHTPRKRPLRPLLLQQLWLRQQRRHVQRKHRGRKSRGSPGNLRLFETKKGKDRWKRFKVT